MKSYTAKNGETLLYAGNPNLDMLDDLASGPGDIWHSGLDQGLANAFPQLKYQAATFWWYINDFPGNESVISWRMSPDDFVVREHVWKNSQGLDKSYENSSFSGMDFGYRMLRYAGAVVLHIQGLFPSKNLNAEIGQRDTFYFFKKFFKPAHAYYMIYRQGAGKWVSLLNKYKAIEVKSYDTNSELVPSRQLQPIQGSPKVTYIIPTMLRHDMCVNLINDLKAQTFHPTEVILVDATPPEKHEVDFNSMDVPFNLIAKQQQTKGSCAARNEALEIATGEYVIFGDDDIRLEPEFVENHIRFLQTYNADACNGLDIMADNPQQNHDDLARKKAALTKDRFRVGVSQSFNNANSCVKKEWIDKIGFNDINFDGGYGEDSDYGIRLVKAGATVLYNPYSVNLHLKPPQGGYRFWGAQSKVKGKARKKQPWELDRPVGDILPVPSPTISYFNVKHHTPEQVEEYRHILMFKKATKRGFGGFLNVLRNKKYMDKQFDESLIYANALKDLGERF